MLYTAPRIPPGRTQKCLGNALNSKSSISGISTALAFGQESSVFRSAETPAGRQCMEEMLFVRDSVVLDRLGAKMPGYKPIGH